MFYESLNVCWAEFKAVLGHTWPVDHGSDTLHVTCSRRDFVGSVHRVLTLMLRNRHAAVQQTTWGCWSDPFLQAATLSFCGLQPSRGLPAGTRDVLVKGQEPEVHGDFSDMTAEKPGPPSPQAQTQRRCRHCTAARGRPRTRLPCSCLSWFSWKHFLHKSLPLRSLAQDLRLEGPPSHSALHRRKRVSPGTVTRRVCGVRAAGPCHCPLVPTRPSRAKASTGLGTHSPPLESLFMRKWGRGGIQAAPGHCHFQAFLGMSPGLGAHFCPS